MAPRLLKILCIVVFAAFAAGCAPTQFSVHDALRRSKDITVIGIVPPDIQVYQISGEGGARLKHASEEASRNAVDAMMVFFKETRYNVKIVAPDFDTRRDLLEVQALSKAVHKSLQEFWNPVQATQAPPLGNIELLAEHYKVDAFIFMDAMEVHKEEQVPLSKSLVKLAVSAVYGPAALPRQGRSRACISLAEPSGSIIWASFRDTEVTIDENFKGQEATRKLVRGLLTTFPR